MPTILGWRVHEWLWRAGWDKPAQRTEEVKEIYMRPTGQKAAFYLSQYQIKYIVVGDKEREAYKKLDLEGLLSLGEVVISSGNHYLIKLVNPQFPDESGQFITPRSPQIIIDKSSLKGCYCNLKIDLLGNIDGPAWTTYNRGYFIANIYPEELKAQIKRSLLSPALLSPAIKQKISNLNKIITEDDNNIILIGKLKESLLNSIEK